MYIHIYRYINIDIYVYMYIAMCEECKGVKIPKPKAESWTRNLKPRQQWRMAPEIRNLEPESGTWNVRSARGRSTSLLTKGAVSYERGTPVTQAPRGCRIRKSGASSLSGSIPRSARAGCLSRLALGYLPFLSPTTETPNPKPQTPNLNSETWNPKPYALNL